MVYTHFYIGFQNEDKVRKQSRFQEKKDVRGEGRGLQPCRLSAPFKPPAPLFHLHAALMMKCPLHHQEKVYEQIFLFRLGVGGEKLFFLISLSHILS